MVLIVNIDGKTTQFNWAWFEKTINGIANAGAFIGGIDATSRAKIDTEKQIQIYRDGVLAFQGEVFARMSYQGGGVQIKAKGDEEELSEVKCPVDSGKKFKLYTSTNDHTIFSNLVTTIAGWSVDVTNSSSQSVTAFKTFESMSIWDGVIKLIKLNNKDIGVDYGTKTLLLYDSKGTPSSFIFNEGQNCSDVTEDKRKPKASKVIVYGKGDGENQVVATAGSGTPVIEISDRSIISSNEASSRATKELALISSNVKNYEVQPFNSTLALDTGDSGLLNAPSVGLSSEGVDIVRYKFKAESNGKEQLVIEVTNPEYRVAKKSQEEEIAEIEAKRILDQTAMLGSGNQNVFGSGINAKTDQSLKIGFYVSPTAFQDEQGNMNITAINVSYDIDPFNKQVGSASFDGTDPQVQNSSGTTGPDLSGSMDNQDNYGVPDLASGGRASLSTGGSTSFVTAGTETGWTGAMTLFTVTILADEDNEEMFLRVYDSTNGNYYPSTTGFQMFSYGDWDGTSGVSNDYVPMVAAIMIPDKVTSATLVLQFRAASSGFNGGDIWYNVQSFGNHKHGFASMQADDHEHPDGSYDVNASDLSNISIGDDVGEAEMVNASSVNLYLDFWNGSSWDTKHSILDTEVIIDQGVDMSNSGTYPDTTGWWRVRVEPITAIPDYTQGVVELINYMDNN